MCIVDMAGLLFLWLFVTVVCSTSLVAPVSATSSSSSMTTSTVHPLHEVLHSESKKRSEKGQENGFLVCSSFGFDISMKGKSVFQETLGEFCERVTSVGNHPIVYQLEYI